MRLMQCLVVGYGSIGKRHVQVLEGLDNTVSLVTSQQVTERSCYSSIMAACQAQHFDYVIIANATHLHYQTLIDLIDCRYEGIVLIEKPLFAQEALLPKHNIKKILVAYNLRFHDLLLQAKQFITGQRLLTFSAYVGQYLPTWRKDRDYRQCYSAKKAEGGGVLRDLSHELDYSLWFSGACQQVTAAGGQLSDLEIDSDDVYSIMMRCVHCPIVNLQVNYLDRMTRREIIINTDKHTLFIDLINGVLKIDGEIVKHSSNGVKQTYHNQHAAIMAQNFNACCSDAEGLEIVKLINKIEQAAAKQQWVSA